MTPDGVAPEKLQDKTQDAIAEPIGGHGQAGTLPPARQNAQRGTEDQIGTGLHQLHRKQRDPTGHVGFGITDAMPPLHAIAAAADKASDAAKGMEQRNPRHHGVGI